MMIALHVGGNGPNIKDCDVLVKESSGVLLMCHDAMIDFGL